LQYIAFHHHFDSGLENSPLRPNEYRNDPDRTWRHLMNAYKSLEHRISELRREITGSGVSLAMTEGHFALPGHNRCGVLASWAAGVAYARLLNVQVRNGDLLKIATLADFCGSLWMVNAIMIPNPAGWAGDAYLMPVARILSLYRKHMGRQAVGVERAPQGLDVTASRRGNRVYLYVVNPRLAETVRAQLKVAGRRVVSGQVFEIADDPWREMDVTIRDAFRARRRTLPANARWSFPPASVTAVELVVEPPGRERR
jgi:hypothetical protein